MTSHYAIYSIGHSNHSPEAFVELLLRHGVATVADVRSQPYSRYCPHFSRESLRPLLEQAGVEYLFLGEPLGGRPDGEEYYDADGHVLYGSVAEAPWFGRGLESLKSAGQASRTAMLCSEENPAVCHRFLLVARVLAQQGIDVLHIRGDGRIESDEEVKRQSSGPPAEHKQLSLFPAEEEEPPWRSIRSVSPASQPASSSRR